MSLWPPVDVMEVERASGFSGSWWLELVAAETSVDDLPLVGWGHADCKHSLQAWQAFHKAPIKLKTGRDLSDLSTLNSVCPLLLPSLI